MRGCCVFTRSVSLFETSSSSSTELDEWVTPFLHFLVISSLVLWLHFCDEMTQILAKRESSLHKNKLSVQSTLLKRVLGCCSHCLEALLPTLRYMFKGSGSLHDRTPSDSFSKFLSLHPRRVRNVTKSKMKRSAFLSRKVAFKQLLGVILISWCCWASFLIEIMKQSSRDYGYFELNGES